MKPSKANLECADVILERNNIKPILVPQLRRDIALAIDIAEREIKKKLPKQTKKKKNNSSEIEAMIDR